MMNQPVSTKKEPLKFFKWMFLENGINYFRDSYFELYYITDAKVDNKNEKVTYYRPISGDKEGEIKEVEVVEYFADKLKEKLFGECHHSLELIELAISNIVFQDNDSTRFLNLQQNILFEIQIKSKEYILKYSFIDELLLKISEHIEKRLCYPTKRTETISTSNVNEVNNQNPVQQLVENIFGYFKNRMESEQEYNRLIKHIVTFIETQILPDETFQRFQYIHNIKNEEIRYTFFVLYSLNKKKINRESLCHFIKFSFNDFFDVSEKYLYSRLNDAPSYFESYIPDIIRDFRREK